MAAVDATTHQEVGIMQIVNLFDDEANFDRLRPATLVTETSYQLPLKQPPQWRFQLNPALPARCGRRVALRW
jgi:hypothetical protein